ncbi:MAG: recombination regulator RecX [Candidatus Omnitrophica bacterium]|nr:recombination regulator RecX [Candidatus Omnitrophota bacterium]
MQKELEAAQIFALRLIKFRMRSKHELQGRLKRKHFSQEVIEQVLDLLSDSGYVNDLTFSKAWVNSRLQFKPRSRKLLAYELKKKGIENSIIEKTLTQLYLEKEEQIARQLAVKRISKLDGLTKETQKRRLSGYLARRGFSIGVTLKVINELVD